MRRRRRKYQWLPSYGDPSVAWENSSIQTWADRYFTVQNTEGSQSIGIFPLIHDRKEEAGDTAVQQLSEIIGQDYVIRRIVGKIWCSMLQGNNQQDSDPDDWPEPLGCIVGVGLFVARAVDNTNGTNTPVGSIAQWGLDYNPLAVQCIREPWIWRRVWRLGNRTSLTNNGRTPAQSNYPSTNVDYGSVLDGPHVDAKTVRRVTGDDRLWMAITVVPQLGDQETTLSNTICQVSYDLRVLGALRRSRNSGKF